MVYTSRANSKSRICMSHHHPSSLPKQPDLSISLWSVDQPGNARLSRWLIGAALATMLLQYIGYGVPLVLLRDSVSGDVRVTRDVPGCVQYQVILAEILAGSPARKYALHFGGCGRTSLFSRNYFFLFLLKLQIAPTSAWFFC